MKMLFIDTKKKSVSGSSVVQGASFLGGLVCPRPLVLSRGWGVKIGSKLVYVVDECPLVLTGFQS